MHEAIKKVVAYTQHHFKSEQEYMESIGYEDLQEHIKLHEKIMQQMRSFLQQLPQMDMQTYERRLIEDIDIWLVHHIVIEDKKIVQFRLSQKYSS